MMGSDRGFPQVNLGEESATRDEHATLGLSPSKDDHVIFLLKPIVPHMNRVGAGLPQAFGYER